MPSPTDRLFAELGEPGVRRLGAARLARLLDRLARRAWRDAASLLRFHDHLLFLLAYPPSRLVRRKCETLLRAIPDRVARLEATGAEMAVFDDPEVAGVAGTTITTDFSYDLSRWLARREKGRVAIDWGGADGEERMRATWPQFLPLLEEEALADANVPYLDWLGAAAGRRREDIGWLLERYERLPFSPDGRAERWDALGAPVSWRLGASRVSRTLMRRPGPAPFFHRAPLLARRDVSLDAVFAAPPLRIRRLQRSEGEKVCDMVREATTVRYREFYTFTYSDPTSVLSARPGRGVEIFLLGVLPERRLPLRSAYGGFVVKNGVPVGYIEGLAFFERLEIGFNLYYAFREGESAWIYAHVLKLHRDALGVTSFSIDPYQLGFENEEAIDSGAFWFYRKLGFRPTHPEVSTRVAREERRMRENSAYRSSKRTLTALVTHNLIYDVPGTPAGEWDRFHVRNLGLAVNRRMRERFAGSVRALREASESRVARALGFSSARLGPEERRAFAGFAPVLDLVPDLKRWPREERHAVRDVISAKAGRGEREYLRRMQRHPRLRDAMIRIGSRR